MDAFTVILKTDLRTYAKQVMAEGIVSAASTALDDLNASPLWRENPKRAEVIAVLDGWPAVVYEEGAAAEAAAHVQRAEQECAA